MQEFLEKLKDNPRVIVATLITAGVIALAIGNNSTTDETNTDVSEETTTSQTTKTEDSATVKETSDTSKVVIGSDPVAGPVDVNKADTTYSATVRSGDNQTVIVRKMVDEYLSNQSQSLSAEQRLYVETVVVDTLPRNNVIFVGDVIKVEETVVADAVAASGELTEAQIALWSAYL